MNSIDNIFCINLPESKDRRTAITQEFQKHDMTNKVVWISATRPDDLSAYEKNNYDRKSGPRCYCLNKCGHRYRKLRLVEVAIAISHRQVYQKIVDQDLDLVMVVEDDIVFHSEFNQILDRLLNKSIIANLLSEQPWIVFLGGRSNNPGLIKNNQKIVVDQIGSYSNYAYILNHAGAQLLLDNFFPIMRPEDGYKRYLIGAGQLNCYQVSPSLIGELSAGVNQPAKFTRLSR